jgi:hypothetical protein
VSGFAVWPLAGTGAGTPVSLDEASFADLLEAARQAPPLAGPLSGTLTQVEGAAALAQAGAEVVDFAVRVRWANPETPFWDTGVAFRDQPDGGHYRLTFDQTGSWAFGVGLEPKLATGGAASMRLGPGVVNTLELVVAGEQAAFSVNGVFVALLDTSAISEPGDVWFGSGFSAGAVTASTAVRYRDLTVWALPSPAESPSGGAEAGTAAQATPTARAPLPTATPGDLADDQAGADRRTGADGRTAADGRTDTDR